MTELKTEVGAPPGLEHLPGAGTPPPEGEVRIEIIDYSEGRVEERSFDAAMLEEAFANPTPDWVTVRWVNVDGLHPWVVEQLRNRFRYHPLAAEDVLQIPQRPSASFEQDHAVVRLRVITRPDHDLDGEQISIFMFRGLLITFQETEGDVWDPIRNRIRTAKTKLRRSESSFLLYALIDAVVDHCFPLLERYGEELEQLEDDVLEEAESHGLAEIQRVRRALSELRRSLWPTRELVDQLVRAESELMSERSRVHLRDVHSNAVQLLDLLASQREHAASLTDLHLASASNRMNEVMKVLTVMASLFIPVTFLAGVYGMNLKYMPELDWRWSYPLFWIVCLGSITGLLLYFRRRDWI